MTLITNQHAQALFSAAILLLEERLKDPNPRNFENATQEILLIAFRHFKLLSSSGNSTPALGGLGLSEAVTLAKDVIAAAPLPNVKFATLFRSFQGD